MAQDMAQSMVRGVDVPYTVLSATQVDAVNELFRKVYRWMAAGLILTALTAYIVAHSEAALRLFYGSAAPLAIVAVAEIGLVLWLSLGINRLSAGTAGVIFTVYSILNGIMCSALLLVYTQGSVYTAFLSTAGMFGLMSVYGLYTQRDLTSLGSFLRMGLFGLLIAMVVNLFLGSSMLELSISIFGVFIFLGLTAWDTQKIRQMAYEVEEEGGMAQKVAVLGALSLYLDFINIFIYLLRLFGKQRQ